MKFCPLFLSREYHVHKYLSLQVLMCRKKKTNVSDTQEKCQTHDLSRCCDVSGASRDELRLFFFLLLYVNQQVLEDIL